LPLPAPPRGGSGTKSGGGPPPRGVFPPPPRNPPCPGPPVPAVDGKRLGNARGRPPGDQRVGRAEHLLRDLGVEEPGGVAAPRRLRETPGPARIGRGKTLHPLVVGAHTARRPAPPHPHQYGEPAP